MNIIYKSFFKKKATKIYLCIFIILSIIFAFLFISKKNLTSKGNEVYFNSFIYFVGKDNIDLEREKNAKTYNKALKAECNNALTDVFVTDNEPIINNNYQYYKQCHIEDYTIEYSMETSVNLVNNPALYNYLKKEQDEYYYFIRLKNWFDKDTTVKMLTDKYHVKIGVEEYKIDSMDYKNVIFIFNIFIKIVELLFVILFIISIFNIIIDEKKNNVLYYSLGYSKIKIFTITLNKILILLCAPLGLLFLTILIVVFKEFTLILN